MPTRCNRWIFIADVIACSTCFGHHYAHHQELESIIQVVAACRIWCLVFKLSVWCGAEGCAPGLRAAAPNTTGSNHLYNTLELLMMGIMVPETCWVSNNICNKNSSVASSWHFISKYYFHRLGLFNYYPFYDVLDLIYILLFYKVCHNNTINAKINVDIVQYEHENHQSVRSRKGHI